MADTVQARAETGRGRPRRAWRLPLALFAAVAVVYLPTVSPDPSPDVLSADFAALNLARTGDPVPTISDYPRLDDHPIREVWIVETADGREAVGRAPGVIAAVVPAYWILRPDTVSAIPGGLTASLITAGTVTLLFLTLRPRIGSRDALLAALIFALTTPMWSLAADGVWPHTLTCFAIMGTAWAADRQRWWLVGLFGGIALWGRLHAAVIWAVFGLLVSLHRRSPSIAVRIGLVSTALLGLMTVWTHWMYGRWDPSSGYRAGDFLGNAPDNALDLQNFLGFFVSLDRGILVWTPLVLLLLPALVRSWRDLPDWSRSLLVAGCAYLTVQGLLVRFSGGDQFYGYRTSLELLACATPALAMSAARMGPVARRLFLPVTVLQFVMITPGAVLDGFFVNAADVWWQNAFIVAWGERPVFMACCVSATLLVALGVIRAWRSPRARMLA